MFIFDFIASLRPKKKKKKNPSPLTIWGCLVFGSPEEKNSCLCESAGWRWKLNFFFLARCLEAMWFRFCAWVGSSLKTNQCQFMLRVMFVFPLARNYSIHEARGECCASIDLFCCGWMNIWILRILRAEISSGGTSSKDSRVERDKGMRRVK